MWDYRFVALGILSGISLLAGVQKLADNMEPINVNRFESIETSYQQHVTEAEAK